LYHLFDNFGLEEKRFESSSVDIFDAVGDYIFEGILKG
jgi:hypothetical protein